MGAIDNVNHPPHYKSRGINCEKCGHDIECIEVTRHFNFNLGNAIKYIWRADYKAQPIEDLRKAIWYLQDEIARRVKIAAHQDATHIEKFSRESVGKPYTCAACHLTFTHKQELDNHWLLCHDSTQVNT
jgi:DNA-directed RNA polymerase subunit RPC12/RpoP